jgi:hypothetical protein
MSDEEPKAMTESEIRAELGEILDQLHRLPADAFADKMRLGDRQAELGRLLREIEIPGAEAIKKRWSEAAASQVNAEEPTEMIVSPIESGGGGW